MPGGLGAALSGTDYHKQGRHIVGESAKRLGINLVAYMLGNTEYGRFLAQDFPMYDGRTRAGDVVRFAAVRYNGSWDLNPAVQNSLLSGLKDNTGIDVDFNAHSVALDDKQTGHFPLLFMTGHYDFQLTDAEAAGLARYLQRGGLLVASAGAGLKPFDTAFKREMKKVLPKAEMVKLPPSHPLFAGGWNAVDRVTYTPYTTAMLRDRSGPGDAGVLRLLPRWPAGDPLFAVRPDERRQPRVQRLRQGPDRYRCPARDEQHHYLCAEPLTIPARRPLARLALADRAKRQAD